MFSNFKEHIFSKLFSIIFLFFSFSVSAIDMSSWGYSTNVNINTSLIFESSHSVVETEFPLLVRLYPSTIDVSRFDFARDQKSIRFLTSDNTVMLAYEIEYWDANKKEAAIWVKIPRITQNNISIKMYWRNDIEQTTSSSKTVFTNANGSYGVWHLSESEVGINAQTKLYKDASENGRDGYDVVSNGGKEGYIGLGQEFSKDYTNYIVIPGPTSDQTINAFTISAWVNFDKIYFEGGTDPKKVSAIFGCNRWWLPSGYQMNALGTQTIAVVNQYVDATSTTQSWRYKTGAYVSPSQWYYTTITWSASSGKLKYFIDGNLYYSEDLAQTSMKYSANVPTYISGEGDLAFPGHLDEVRESHKAYSEDWIKLCYYSQRIEDNIVQIGLPRVEGYLPLVGGTMYGSIRLNSNANIRSYSLEGQPYYSSFALTNDKKQVAITSSTILDNISSRSSFILDPQFGVYISGSNGALPAGNLNVQGQVEASSIKIKNWVLEEVTSIPPDYVFEKDYKLKPLHEVEKFIKNNKHLPDVPSAKEINQGANLMEMNYTLLRKIEELTLYSIDQKKEIEALRADLNKLKTSK